MGFWNQLVIKEILAVLTDGFGTEANCHSKLLWLERKKPGWGTLDLGDPQSDRSVTRGGGVLQAVCVRARLGGHHIVCHVSAI